MKPEAINICGLTEPATKLLGQNLEQSPDKFVISANATKQLCLLRGGSGPG